MIRIVLTILGAFLLAGCTLFDSVQETDCLVPDTDLCGSNYQVTSWYEAPKIHGWNITVQADTSREEVIAIADKIASTKSGRRFMIFYSEDETGFNSAPTTLDHEIQPSSQAWVAIFDYIGDYAPDIAWQS